MLKIGLIGAGQAAKAHLASYEHIKDVKVVAIADIVPERAEELAAKVGAEALDHGDKIFEREDIDVVDICLPTYLHHEYVLKAANAKKHVLCEMPMALTLEQAKEMIEATEQAKVKFMVGHTLRFSPKYLSTRAAIEEGSIGTPRAIRAYRGGAHPGRNISWYGELEKSGGAIHDMAIHDIDFLRWCFGPVKEVYAKGNVYEEIENLEYDMITLEFEAGLIAHVAADWSKPEGTPFSESLDIAGDVGVIIFESDQENSLDATYEGSEGGYMDPESPLDPFSDPTTRMIMSFIDAIQKDIDVPVDPVESLESLKIALGAMESIRNNKPISIKEAF